MAERYVSASGTTAETATILGISEAAANGLVGHCTAMLRELLATHEHQGGWALGWPNAVIIAGETTQRRTTGLPAADITKYDALLLGKARDCSLSSFKGKVRRLRERLHHESIPARTCGAYRRQP